MSIVLWILGSSLFISAVVAYAYRNERKHQRDIRRRRCPMCECESILSWRGYLNHLKRCEERRAA